MGITKELGRKSIRDKIIWQFSILVASFILLMIFSFGYMILNKMKEQAQATLKARAVSIESKIEERIEYLINNTALLSKNELMINSLIDDEGKKRYLTSLANNFMEDKNVEYLNIVDFDGKVIFQTSENIPSYNNSPYLRGALVMGKVTYYLNKDINQLIVISPMKYYNTTQGALIATFNLNKILDKYLLHDTQEYVNIISDGKVIYNSNFVDNIEYYSYLLESDESSLLSQFGISLKIGVLESIYLSPIEDTLLKLSFLGLLLVVISMLFSYLLAVSITNPILELYTRINKKISSNYEPLGTDDELEILSKAFYERTRKLYESENLIHSVINGIQDLIFFKDKDFVYIGCNEAFLKFTGKSKEQIIGYTDFEIFNEEVALLFRKMDEVMLENNKSRINDEWITYPDGTQRYMQTMKSPFKYDSKNRGILGISRDITELNRLQNEELNKQKILSQQSKMAAMGEMIGNIAHQWRQPLSIISTASTGMKLQLELNVLKKEQIIKNCDFINDNAQYLSKTIDDFRNFIKGDREKHIFDLKENIESFLKLTEGTIKSNNINVIVESDENILIDGYANELIQCFINIFNNAKDALKNSHYEEKYFFIKLHKENEKAIIQFQDNAGGIPQNVLPHIFNPYFTTKHSSQGTGLGLHMTYGLIVDGMKGSIEAKNITYIYNEKTYTGAEFLIFLPLSYSPSEKDKIESSEEPIS